MIPALKRAVLPLVVVAMLRGLLSAEPAQATTIVAVPTSIASDCSVDVSADLTAFLQSVPNYSIIQFPADGCYLTQTFVQVTGKSVWTIDGNGSTFQRTQDTPTELQYPKANPFLWLVDPSNVTVDGLDIQGIDTAGVYNSTFPFDAGFRIDTPYNVTVKNSTMTATYGDGIQINGTASHVTVDHDTISLDGRQGISFVAGSYFTVTNTTIDRSARAGIDMENNLASQTISNVLISGNTTNTHLLAFTAGGPGVVNGVQIENNTIVKSGYPWLNDADGPHTPRQNWTVDGNTVQQSIGSGLAAMVFDATTGVHVDHNTMTFSTGSTGYYDIAVQLKDSTTGAQINCDWFAKALNPGYVKTDTTSTWTGSGNSTDPAIAPAC